MAEPEIDAADAIEYVEQFMQAQGAYNPAAIAALAYARKALAENVSLRAALAGAEQATTDARREPPAQPLWVFFERGDLLINQAHPAIAPLRQLLIEIDGDDVYANDVFYRWQAALAANLPTAADDPYDSGLCVCGGGPNVRDCGHGSRRCDDCECDCVGALAADVPAAADELSCPCPAVGVFAKDCPQHGDHPDAVPAAPTLPAGLDVHTADLARQAIAVVRAEGDNGRSVLIRTLKLMRERIRDEGGDFALKPLIPYAEWAMGQTADVPAAADHEHPGGYLSTACLHGLCEPECGAAQRARGYIGHPTCKYCQAKCTHSCHTGGQVERAERVHVDGCTLAADDPHHSGWCALPTGEVIARVAQSMRDANTRDAWTHPQIVPMDHFARVAIGTLRELGWCGPNGGVPAAGEAEVAPS